MTRWAHGVYIATVAVLAAALVWQIAENSSLNGTPEKGGNEWRQVDLVGLAEEESSDDLEKREARLAIVQFDKENARLRKEVLDLQKQVRKLTDFLASRSVEANSSDSRSPGEVKSPDFRGRLVRIVDVNESLDLVVLDQGTKGGVRRGMVFSVLRNGDAIGRIKVVDAREFISGAELEQLEEGAFPVPGDQAVPLDLERVR